MKPAALAVASLLTIGFLDAAEPARKAPRPAKPAHPSIIQIAPSAGEAAMQPLLHTELAGRDIEFLQGARRYAALLLRLAELSKGRGSSEQVASVAEMLASMQSTELEKLDQLAASRKLPPAAVNAGALQAEFASLEGPRFEKAWIERLIAVTEGSARAYEVGMKSSDAELRAFIDKMLPVVLARRQMANRLGGRPVPPAAANPAPGPAPIPPPTAPGD